MSQAAPRNTTSTPVAVFIDHSAEYLDLDVPEHLYVPGVDLDQLQEAEEERMLRQVLAYKQSRQARAHWH